MTDEDLINNMAENLEKVLNKSIEGNGLHAIQNQAIKDKFYRLIELSRIGASVQPRPIEEAIPEQNCLVFDSESQQWGEAFRNSEYERWYWAGGGPGEYVDMEIGVPDWFIPLSAFSKPQEPT